MKQTNNKTYDEEVYPGAAIDKADGEQVNERLTKQYTKELNCNPRSDNNAV